MGRPILISQSKKTMRQNEIEYVFLDGMWLQENQLLKLAMNVGSFQLAEHYLCALLFDAVAKGKREVLDEVNRVREHYGVAPIPLSDEDMKDDQELRGKSRVTASDLQAKKLFLKMEREERLEVLRVSMSLFLSDYHLFIYARHWLSIFMVVRDRLVGPSLSQVNFTVIANEIAPKEMPQRLRFSDTTRKNFMRQIADEERDEVYFKMKKNPQKQLCDTFWDIVKNTILTQK